MCNGPAHCVPTVPFLGWRSLILQENQAVKYLCSLVPERGREVDLCEMKASLVYRATRRERERGGGGELGKKTGIYCVLLFLLKLLP